MKTRPLTERALRFCDEYLVDLDGAAAARRAGYAPKSAATAAWKLMREPLVQAEIAARQARRITRTEINADKTIRELAHLGFSDIGDLFDAEGKLKPLASMPEAARRSIASIEVDELFEGNGVERTCVGLTRKVKLWDKPAALRLIAQHLGMLVEKVEHTGTVTLEQLVPKRKPKAGT